MVGAALTLINENQYQSLEAPSVCLLWLVIVSYIGIKVSVLKTTKMDEENVCCLWLEIILPVSYHV